MFDETVLAEDFTKLVLESSCREHQVRSAVLEFADHAVTLNGLFTEAIGL